MLARKKFHLLETYRSSQIGSFGVLRKGSVCWEINFRFRLSKQGPTSVYARCNRELGNLCYSLQSLLSGSSKVLSGESEVRVSLFENFPVSSINELYNRRIHFLRQKSTHTHHYQRLSQMAYFEHSPTGSSNATMCVIKKSFVEGNSQMRELMQQPSS